MAGRRVGQQQRDVARTVMPCDSKNAVQPNRTASHTDLHGGYTDGTDENEKASYN